MVSKKRLTQRLITLCIFALAGMLFGGCDTTRSSSADIKTLAAGETLEIAGITCLGELTIAEGAAIIPPEGHNVTLTVNGVETPIAPGTYTGDVVLTPAENIVIEYGGMGASETYNYRVAIYVKDGVYIPGKSVAAAVVGGEVTDTSATDISITSVGENFNGIMAMGNSEYTVQNPRIDFTGNGGNDFAGYGAAVMSSDNADMTLNNADIVTRGAVRPAVFVGGDSTMHVNDSRIEVYNGTLPEDYQFSVTPGQMKEVPWMLGITGNVRATNLAGNGVAYFNNTHIKAQGWGCLSTDDVGDTPRVYATKCLIETTESGYGAFTLGSNVSTFSECTFNVTDMAVISQDGDAVFTDATVVNSGRFGAMYFGSTGDLTIEKGCEFNSESTALMMKGSNSNIVVDNATLNPANGIILQMMANDDPYMANMAGGGMPGGSGGGGPGAGMPDGAGGGPGMGAPPESGMPDGAGGAPPQGEAPGGDPGGAPDGGMPPGGGMPGGGGDSGGDSSSDVNATFSNMTLYGDLINGNTTSGDLKVTFKSAAITGAISTAVVKNALGPNGEEVTMEHPELYYLIGEVTNTFKAMPDAPYGVIVSLDKGSSWVVKKTSYLTGLTVAEGAVVSAPDGRRVTMTVDGVETAVKAGTYEGSIVLTPAS